MPLQTFKNLSTDRQQEILEVCFEEFAVNDYQSASVSSIVRKLGISKGGFYRYFKDKKDLYHYLLEQVMQMRMQDVQNLFAYTDDFRELLIQNFYQKIRFDMEHPVYGQFLYNTTQERHSDDLGDLMLQIKASITETIKMMLKSFQEQGKIRQDIDNDIIAFTVLQIQLGVYDFLLIRHKIDQQKRVLQKNPTLFLPEEEIMKLVTDFVEIIVHGLKPATG